ncbi:hypothetical protein SUGI_0553140 [Cryptomeria japonica]|nr:hypothetical protein SUGI_0553140 [Cryptomeria japonica]
MIRGSEKRRHLLTAGWRVFVNSERLVAGDAFIFMRDKNGELHVGVGVPCISKVTFLSVVISSRRMEIFVLAAASHAIPGRAMFRVYYKPRWSGSKWRCLKVQWDAISAIPRPEWVLPWKIEPVLTPLEINPLPIAKNKKPRPNILPSTQNLSVLNKD